MNLLARRIVPPAFATVLFVVACRSFGSLPDTVAHRVVERWHRPSALAAGRLLDEYGLPDDVTPNRLTWNRKGVWKRTTVWNANPVYRTPADMAVVEQTVDYPLDASQAARLLAFSGALKIDLERGELSSRSDREEIDFLNLNLADEIVHGRKTVDEAKASYARLLSLSATGKSSPYTSGLLFRPVHAR